jgi:hypothetical protein
MTTSATIETVNSAVDLARAKVAELRKIAAGSPIGAKVAGVLEDLTNRLAKVELSFVEAAKSAPMHRRG